MTKKDSRLTRDEAVEALGLPVEILDKMDRAGLLAPDRQGRFGPLELAAAAVRYGLGRAEAADRKLARVGASLGDVKPALERLAALADRAELTDEAHHRATVEIAAFFTAFAGVMNRATEALHSDQEDAARDA